MRKQLAILSFIFLSNVVWAQTTSEPNDSEGEIRYISDDLYTYLHAGPGRNFRILGSVQAGTKVTQLQIDAEKNFVEVIDDKQRTGWVDASFITKTQSIRELVPELQERVREASQLSSQQENSNELLNQQIADLSSQNNQLKRQLDQLQKENADMQNKLATKDQSAQMEWFTRGGIIALVSILVGVIIAYLPKKRRRNDQWM